VALQSLALTELQALPQPLRAEVPQPLSWPWRS
jgi:hypothetical protein